MIKVFSPNLLFRVDRLTHIRNEFKDKNQYELNIVKPVNHKTPTQSLWITLQQLIKNEVNRDDYFFILCEDDHQFTENYSSDFLNNCIAEAQQLNADILLGGVSWQKTSIQISDNLFWVEKFSGLQFTVIFRKFYNSILSAQFGEMDTADHKISDLTDKKFVIYPAISTQKEFGYSDVTPGNNAAGRVGFLFKKTNHILDSLKKVNGFYAPDKEIHLPKINYEEITLPVYVINLKERPERLAHIQSQFAGKSEFDVTVVEAIKDKNGRHGLWKSIVKAVRLAIENEDDFMILCEDDHVFTEHYDRNRFIENILQAYYQKAALLSGGVGGFGLTAPVTENRYWVDWFWCTQFVVIYKQFYPKILSYAFQDNDTADGVFSKLSNNKMVIYPFISVQQDFGYSDVTKHNNDVDGIITKFFEDAKKRFEVYHNVAKRYIHRTDESNKSLIIPVREIPITHLKNNVPIYE